MKNQEQTLRLIYVSISKNNMATLPKFDQLFGISDQFKLPDGMSMEDACKVVSYLSNEVQSKHNIILNSPKNLSCTCNQLLKYGFEKINGGWSGFINGTAFDKETAVIIPKPMQIAYTEQSNCMDLFVVGGNPELFKETVFADKYFNWFSNNVTRQDIMAIYQKTSCENISFLSQDKEL